MSTEGLPISAPLFLRVWGDAALFTRPEMKVERVSYDMMTPSAARGILEAILWKPQMRWIVERIDLFKPIKFQTVRRNEVGSKATNPLGIDAEDHRQQRAAMILRDVEYVIGARISLTERSGPQDSLIKYVEMFRRRAASGQCFHRPCLGTREFAANFALVENELPVPLDITRELGWMLLDIAYDGASPVPLFFNAHLQNGSLGVPHLRSTEVRR